jgi:hypothetical protein
MLLRSGLLALGLLLTFAPPAAASTFTYATTLGPEVAGATGSGSATVTYDDAAHTLSITTGWSGLSGTTTVAHGASSQALEMAPLPAERQHSSQGSTPAFPI